MTPIHHFTTAAINHDLFFSLIYLGIFVCVAVAIYFIVDGRISFKLKNWRNKKVESLRAR